MFCPKCGTQNIETAKFCRVCGTDLSVVTEALTGKLVLPEKFSDNEEIKAYIRRNDPSEVFSDGIRNMLTGLAFLTIAIVLGTTGIIGGKVWWFWMLIPAFTMIGKGIGDFAKYRKMEEKAKLKALSENQSQALPATSLPAGSLPAQQIYEAPARQSFFGNNERYKTGELVEQPLSITENTTRHLEINTEGETMTLPKQ